MNIYRVAYEAAYKNSDRHIKSGYSLHETEKEAIEKINALEMALKNKPDDVEYRFWVEKTTIEELVEPLKEAPEVYAVTSEYVTACAYNKKMLNSEPYPSREEAKEACRLRAKVNSKYWHFYIETGTFEEVKQVRIKTNHEDYWWRWYEMGLIGKDEYVWELLQKEKAL